MFMTLCVNLKPPNLLATVLQRVMDAFDQGALSDHYQTKLFQYTRDCCELFEMFRETDDFEKYLFFESDPYLCRVTVPGSDDLVIVPKSVAEVDRYLLRSESALFTVKRLLRNNVHRNL